MTTGNSVSRMRLPPSTYWAACPWSDRWGSSPGMMCRHVAHGSPATRSSLSLTKAARRVGFEPAIEVRVESKRSTVVQPVSFAAAVGRTSRHSREISPGAFGCGRPRRDRPPPSRLDVGDHDHGHAMPDGIIDRGLSDELHHQRRLRPAARPRRSGRRCLSPRRHCRNTSTEMNRAITTDFKLIGRRGRPELDAQHALNGKHRGLPAHLPLARIRSRCPGIMRAQTSSVEGRRSRIAQSPPSMVRTRPGRRKTVLTAWRRA